MAAPQSNAYTLGAVFAAAVQQVAQAQGAAWADHPALPLDGRAAGERLLFVLSRGDKLVDQPGQQPERRRIRLVLGAMARGADARALADALHFAARDALKSLAFRQALRDSGVRCEDLREVEVEPELRESAADGAAIMSAYEIDYFQAYPSFGT